MKLILHFDINKTILINDGAGGMTTQQMFNSIISESAWGKIKDPTKAIHERTHLDWVPFTGSNSLNVMRSEPNDKTVNSNSEYITFGDYYENHTTLTRDERKKLRMKSRFTEPGYPGEHFRHHYNELEKRMRIDSVYTTPMDGSILPSYLQSSYFHIIPSFFNMVSSLVSRMHTDSLDFKLIFRTFGFDSSKISQEFNDYCEGKHILFKPPFLLDGSPPISKDFRIHLPRSSMKFIRTGSSIQDTRLACINSENTIQVVSGADQCYEHILCCLGMASNLSKELVRVPENTLIIGDDFHYWNGCSESDDSGKLLLVKTGKRIVNEDHIIQIFFDDNIERNRAHIVDVRDLDSFNPIPFDVSNGLYIRRVSPLQAIENPEYYIEQIDEVLKKYSST